VPTPALKSGGNWVRPQGKSPQPIGSISKDWGDTEIDVNERRPGSKQIRREPIIVDLSLNNITGARRTSMPPRRGRQRVDFNKTMGISRNVPTF
jgi:hypothetical protein